MKQIFLISGEAQNGKDSVANFLKEKLPGKSLIIHNADYLKFIARNYLDWDGNKDKNSRTMLQQLGTEKTKIKLNKPLYWTEKVCDVIEIFQDDFDYFCIPDTRFISEIRYPQARFPNSVITVRVHRLNFDNGLTPEQKSHISERELVDFKHDFEIFSESGLDKLEKEVDAFIYRLSL
jgi:hypothetical protein